MNVTITPGSLRGAVAAIPSKSQAHRLLICAALAGEPTVLRCTALSRDILATADCLRALGARVDQGPEGFLVAPGSRPRQAEADCGESGSTLRFLLPVAGALGVDTTFRLHGRLPQRPLSPLWEEMERMGIRLSRPTADTVRCEGSLEPGTYTLAGDVSSQFISGLLFALPDLPGDSEIRLTGSIQSKPYLDMTVGALQAFGIEVQEADRGYQIPGNQRFRSPGTLTVEGDWSNGAFWLTARALGSDLRVTGLDPRSPQGDRAAETLLPRILNGGGDIDVSQIPDLVPALAVAAAQGGGVTRFVGAGRLRIKESDRIASVSAMLRSLGGQAEEGPDFLTVYPTGLVGGTVSAENDHRIAMAAAVASTICRAPVTVLGAEAVEKSYPAFWQDFRALGGEIREELP